MHPILFEIAGYPVTSYGLALLAAFAVGIAVARRRAQARGLSGERVVDLSLWIVLAAFVGARLLWVATHPERIDGPLALLDPLRGVTGSGGNAGLGLSMHGGVALALLVAVLWLRRHRLPFLPYADVMAPSLLLGEAIARVGCFLNGCCHGLPSQLPWAVAFPAASLADRAFPGARVQPTQLYAVGLMLLGFAVVLTLARRRPPQGVVFAASLLWIGLARIVLDAIRWHEPGAILWQSGALLFTVHQALCLGLVALALGVWRWARRAPHPMGTSPH